MENIDKLVKNIKEDLLHFSGKYDYKNYSGEVSEIMHYQETMNINSLLKFWNDKINERYFALKHPVYNNIITYAASSIQLGAINVVLMLDKEKNHPWVFIQFSHLIDCFIYENEVRDVTCLWHGFSQGFVRTLGGYLTANHYFPCVVRKEWGFELFNVRPWHYYYFGLMYLLCIENYSVKKIRKDNFYFFLENLNLTDSSELVFIAPYVIEPVGERFIKLRQNFSKIIYNQAIYNNIIPSNDVDLTLWISLPGEKREWINQVENMVFIVKELFNYFNKIKIYFDGMTNYENASHIFSQNEAVYLNFMEAMSLYIVEKKCEIISLIGKNHRQKILHCSTSDICIIDAGSGALAPMFFCQKPCVLFYGEVHVKKFFYLNRYDVYADEKNILSMRTNGDPMRRPYHIPYQHIYNLAAEVLEELSRENKLKVKNLKMHRLEVPSVELIAKQYELEKQFEIKVSLENVEFVDKLATQLQQKDQIIQTKNQELEFKNQELTSKNQELTQTKNQLDTIKVQLDSTKQQLESKTKELSFLPIKKQTLEIKNLEQDLINKQLHTKQLEKELGYESNVLKELELKKQELIQTKNQLDSTKKELELKSKQLESKNKILISNPNPSHLIQNTSQFKGKLAYLNTLTTAKDRIHNHLSYKLGQAMIENSKSLLGYIRMPYVLSYIKDKHKQEQQQYQEAIKKNPNLKLPNLESYPDYKESLKEKECLTYKLGEAFIKADKTWYKGGYVKLWFEVRKLKGERKKSLEF